MPFKNKMDYTITCPLLADVFNVLVMKYLMGENSPGRFLALEIKFTCKVEKEF